MEKTMWNLGQQCVLGRKKNTILGTDWINISLKKGIWENQKWSNLARQTGETKDSKTSGLGLFTGNDVRQKKSVFRE